MYYLRTLITVLLKSERLVINIWKTKNEQKVYTIKDLRAIKYRITFSLIIIIQ